jgi:hypothetical protein
MVALPNYSRCYFVDYLPKAAVSFEFKIETRLTGVLMEDVLFKFHSCAPSVGLVGRARTLSILLVDLLVLSLVSILLLSLLVSVIIT